MKEARRLREIMCPTADQQYYKALLESYENN